MIWTFGWRFFDLNEYRIRVVQEKVEQNSCSLLSWATGPSEFMLFCWHETVPGYALYVSIRYGKSHLLHVKSRIALKLDHFIRGSGRSVHDPGTEYRRTCVRIVQSEVSWHVTSRKCVFTVVKFGKLWYSVLKHQLSNYSPELVRPSSLFIFVCTKA